MGAGESDTIYAKLQVRRRIIVNAQCVFNQYCIYGIPCSIQYRQPNLGDLVADLEEHGHDLNLQDLHYVMLRTDLSCLTEQLPSWLNGSW
jgi:hypothetical protein